MIRDSKELQIGKAGEYLTCADLIIKGFISFPSEQGLPYDVLLDTGKKLLKVQVKTTLGPRVVPQRKKDSRAYVFNVKRAGKGGKLRYEKDEIDLFALVCIDTMKVGYIQNNFMPQTLILRVDHLRGSYYDEKGIVDCAKVRELKKSNSNAEVFRLTGISQSTICRYSKDDFIPHLTNAKYFSDLIRTKEWFYDL